MRLLTLFVALLLGLGLLSPSALAATTPTPTPTPTPGTSAPKDTGPTLPARPEPHPLAEQLANKAPSPASRAAAAAASAGSAKATATKPPTPSAGKSCYTILGKIKPGRTDSDVLAQACRAKGDTTAPARVAEPASPSAKGATPQAAPQAAGVTVPLITFYEYSNYGGDSYTVYGNSGPCDSSGYGISNNNTANDAVDGIRSYKAFNNCTNQTLYNQTQYGGPATDFFGTATPYVGDTYADELLSVHLRTRCTTYSPSNNNVCDWIRQNYEANGGPSGFLGAPTSNQLTNTDNVGARQTFANTGAIYWAPATGAHAVQGSILTKYNQFGNEGGVLGYPTRDNTRMQDNVGVSAAFYKGSTYAAGTQWTANGAIVYGPSTGTFEMDGALATKYASMNDVAGILGYPLTDTTTTSDNAGKKQQFSKSRWLYWSSASGAHDVSAGTMPMWEGDGFEQGAFGYPTEDEQPSSDGKSAFARFTNGYYQLGAVNITSQPSSSATSRSAQPRAAAAPQDTWVVNVAVEDPHPSKGAETAGVPTVVFKSRCFLTGPTPLTIHATGLLRSAPGNGPPAPSPTSGYTIRSTSAYDQVCQNNTGKTPGQTWYTPQQGAPPVNGTGWYDGGAAMDCPNPPQGAVQIAQGIKLTNKRYYVNP